MLLPNCTTLPFAANAQAKDSAPRGVDEMVDRSTLRTEVADINPSLFLRFFAEFGDRRAADIPVLGRDIFKNDPDVLLR
jgi:hypothetical protein